MNQKNLTHIKQYFQEKTGVCLTDQKVSKRPLQRVALLAAVLVCCLTVAAAAASVLSGSSIVEYFRSGGAIPPGVEDVTVTFDAQVVEDYTQQVVQSVQTGEVTVTLQTVTSANTSHATFVYCVFEVAAPAGTWNNVENTEILFEHHRITPSGCSSRGTSSHLYVMDDAAGRENFKTVVICFLIQADEQIPSQVEIQLENLQLCKDRTDGPDRVIQQGDWNFTAPVKPSGAACMVEGQIPLADATGTLYQLELSALGGSYVVDDGTLAKPTKLIMQDGSTIDIIVDGGAADQTHETATLSFLFAAPTDLSQAVSVTFSDGTQIDLQK